MSIEPQSRLRTIVGVLAISLVSFITSHAQYPGEPPPPPPVLRPSANTVTLAPSDAPVTEPEPEIEENDIVRVSTNLITVPAEVMDRNGRFIGSLTRNDFRIFENGVEQELAYFAPVEQPFTVALLLDVSGSTQTQLQAIRAAANTFIKRLRPNDRLLLISFDGKINILTEAVTLERLRQKRLRLDALNDGTLLYDTVGFTLNQRLAAIQGRKAIVLLTDGVDSGSKQNHRQNLRDAEEANVVIYTVRYNTLPQLPQRLSQIINPKSCGLFLGGDSGRFQDFGECQRTYPNKRCSWIRRLLQRTRSVLGYYGANNGDGWGQRKKGSLKCCDRQLCCGRVPCGRICLTHELLAEGFFSWRRV